MYASEHDLKCLSLDARLSLDCVLSWDGVAITSREKKKSKFENEAKGDVDCNSNRLSVDARLCAPPTLYTVHICSRRLPCLHLFGAQPTTITIQI